jgi:hypothetical protein
MVGQISGTSRKKYGKIKNARFEIRLFLTDVGWNFRRSSQAADITSSEKL